MRMRARPRTMGDVGIRRVIRAVQRWGDTPELRVVHLGSADTDVSPPAPAAELS